MIRDLFFESENLATTVSENYLQIRIGNDRPYKTGILYWYAGKLSPMSYRVAKKPTTYILSASLLVRDILLGCARVVLTPVCSSHSARTKTRTLFSRPTEFTDQSRYI